MSSDGPDFYDHEQVFQTYLQHHHRLDGPEETLEKPLLWELIGDTRRLRVLDLGCGDAAIGKELLESGAQSYTGVEGSQNMVALAQRVLDGTGGAVVHSYIQTWEYPPSAFDMVIALLALHYIPDLEPVFRKVFGTLKTGGRFVFSVEHPVITSCDRAWRSGGVRQDWIVDDYFETGPRTTDWLGGQIVKFHRTIEDYFTSLQQAGFVVEQLRESRPQRDRFVEEETYQRRKRIPLFLFLAGRKA